MCECKDCECWGSLKSISCPYFKEDRLDFIPCQFWNEKLESFIKKGYERCNLCKCENPTTINCKITNRIIEAYCLIKQEDYVKSKICFEKPSLSFS